MNRIDSNNIKKEIVACICCGSANNAEIGSGVDVEFKTSSDVWKNVLCENCGHIYLNPRPEISQAARIYPTDYYPFPDRMGLAEKFVYIARSIVEKPRYRNIGRLCGELKCVIDIGAGDGRVLGYLRDIYGDSLRLIAIDICVDDKTKEFFKQRKIEYFEGAFEAIDVSMLQSTADIVLLNQVIEHFWDPMVGLLKIGQILRKDGICFVETPNPNSACRYIQGGSYWGGWHRPRHLNIFTRQSFDILAKTCKFDIIKYEEFTVPAFWIMGVRVKFNIATSYFNSIFSRVISMKSIPALVFYTMIEFFCGILGLGRSNHRFIIKKGCQ